MNNLISKRSLFHGVMLYIAMILLLVGCATGGNQKLVIDTSQVPAVDNLPGEVTSMLEDLGYEVIPESDETKFTNTFTDYNMRFKARDAENVRVDVQFMLVDRLTRIHLYNTGEKTPSAATVQRYNTIRKRAEWEFGVDSVK